MIIDKRNRESLAIPLSLSSLSLSAFNILLRITSKRQEFFFDIEHSLLLWHLDILKYIY